MAAAPSTRVFVGNLAFRTTDQNLIDTFGKYGAVKSAGMVTRGRRSLGYGFVEFASADQAVAAVAGLNNSQLLERQIKVEIAKEASERPPREPREPREPRAPQPSGGEGGDAPAERRRRAPRRRRSAKEGEEGGANSNGDASPSQPRAPRAPRPPRPDRPKVDSETTVFVANLPFSVEDESLQKIFESHKPKSAHVVRARTGRSRGYGFVEFNTKADQQAAIAQKNNLSIDAPNGARTITVSVSNSAPIIADAQ